MEKQGSIPKGNGCLGEVSLSLAQVKEATNNSLWTSGSMPNATSAFHSASCGENLCELRLRIEAASERVEAWPLTQGSQNDPDYRTSTYEDCYPLVHHLHELQRFL
jgi:hypothetical protein